MLLLAGLSHALTTGVRRPRCAVRAAPVCQAGDPTSALSKTFWDGKQQMLEAELAAKLAELEEFEAREAALVESLAQGLPLPAPTPPAAIASDEALERRVAELEAELEAKGMEAERALQRTGAFWIEQVATLRQRAVAAEINAAAAEARAAKAEATGRLLSERLPGVANDLQSLLALVAPAQPAPAPTTATAAPTQPAPAPAATTAPAAQPSPAGSGLDEKVARAAAKLEKQLEKQTADEADQKAEEKAEAHRRAAEMSWDPSTMTWVPIPSKSG